MTHSPDGASAGGLDLDALEKVALAATPGPWTASTQAPDDPNRCWLYGRIGPNNPSIASIRFGVDLGQDIAAGVRGNREYLITFDPPTVLKMIAALRALSPSPGLGEEGVHLAPNVRGQEPRSSVLTSTPCQSEDAETSASIEYLRNVVAQTRPVGMTLSNDVRRLLAAYDRLQRERLQLDGLLPSANPSRDAIWDDGYEAGSRDHAGRRDEALALVRRELWWVGTCQPDRSAWTAVLTLDWPEFEALRRVAGLKPYRALSSEAPSPKSEGA